ncbi:P-loop NTPase fold protein [Clostridium tyrobutyricum]|uniref:KAP family P-loop NTPase fold protein n=1 Tax=Clostridium tyrobutyricum TaxID=1519 RepID=UPI002B20244B|nr:P-loop NTPase fold protein [Clostridium tyrobutyricum]MEA5009157.1 P-loop NTPase fold protein [Clostridium tyrobutyricum]
MWRDSETELDFLDFNYLIMILEDTINDKKLLPSSIGVYGDWGSGKSSLINMCKNKLEGEEGTVCLLFNGWLFEGYEDAKTAIIGSILDEIASKKKISQKAKDIIKGLNESIDKFKLVKSGVKYGADILLTGGIGIIADLTIKNIINKALSSVKDIDENKIKDNIKNQLNNKEFREDIRKFRGKFAELLNESKIEKLVIFIDELDRCNPSTILDTLEAMRLFLFAGNVAFVIGADERHISYAVKSKFSEIEGIQIDIGKEYLEKLIQYPIRIPRLNESEVQYYIMCLLFQLVLSEDEFQCLIHYLNVQKEKDFMNFKVDYKMIETHSTKVASKVQDSIIVATQLSRVLAKGLNGNPRQCKRFLNTLDMRMKMAKYKHINLDVKILAKLMEVEYIKISLFKKLAQLETSGILKEELKKLEDKDYEDLNELNIWKEDEWVKKWALSKPKISEMKLDVYFYFARTSLDDRTNILGAKMSKQGIQLYEKLSNGSDLQLRSALKKSDTVGESDATLILNKLYDDLIQDDELDNKKFKSFLKWGEIRNELHIESISLLKGIDGNKVGLGLIPLICDFKKNTKRSLDIDDIFDKWKTENPKLSKIIQSLNEGEQYGNIK